MTDTSERRYSDAEVQEILSRAAEADATSLTTPGADGWTLADIQRVAAEAGLAESSVVAAARSLNVAATNAAVPRVLGAPLSVSVATALPRPLSEAEWRRVVHLARDTFAATGREMDDVLRHEWRNGNLRVTADRDAQNARLELRSFSGQGRRLFLVGGGLAVGGSLVSAMIALTAHTSLLYTPAPIFLGVGVALMAAARVRVSHWAATRRAQFEQIIQFAAGMASEGQSPALPPTPRKES